MHLVISYSKGRTSKMNRRSWVKLEKKNVLTEVKGNKYNGLLIRNHINKDLSGVNCLKMFKEKNPVI